MRLKCRLCKNLGDFAKIIMKLQGVKVVESGCVSLEEQISAILLVKCCSFYVEEVFYDVRM